MAKKIKAPKTKVIQITQASQAPDPMGQPSQSIPYTDLSNYHMGPGGMVASDDNKTYWQRWLARVRNGG
jgi:hypothetical protein